MTNRESNGGSAGDKPKARINLRFLGWVLLVVAVVLAGTAGIWYYALQRNLARYQAAGEKAGREGRLAETLSFYGRALLLEHDTGRRVKLMRDAIGALEKMPPPTEAAAYFHACNILAYQEKIVNESPADKEALRLWLANSFRMARAAGTREAWDAFRAKTGRLAAAAHPDPAVIKYDAIVNVLWMFQCSPDEKTRTEIGNRLKRIRLRLPDDGELAYFLAEWNAGEAKIRASLPEQASASSAYRENAVRIMDEYVARHPAELDARLKAAGILLGLEGLPGGADAGRRARGMVSAAGAEFASGGHAELAVDFARLLCAGDTAPQTLADGAATTGGMEKAIRFLQTFLAVHPEQTEGQYELGRLCRQTRRLDVALAAFGRASKVGPPAVSFTIQKSRNIRAAALWEWLDLRLEMLEEAERADGLAEIKDRCREFQALAASPVAGALLEARILLREGRLWEAYEKAGAVCDENPQDAAPALWTGIAASRMGEHAEAVRRCDAVFGMTSSSGEQRIAAARTMAPALIRMLCLDAAGQLLQAMDKALPSDPDVQMQEADLLMTRARLTGFGQKRERGKILRRAEALLQALAKQGHPDASKRTAELHMLLGETGAARVLLMECVKTDPQDAELWCRLVSAEQALGMADWARTHMETALATVPPGRAAALARQALSSAAGSGTLPLDGLLRAALERSPVRREVLLAGLAFAAGMPAEAEQAVVRAKALSPKDPDLFRLLINRALEENRFIAVKGLLQEAPSVVLDPVEVLLWQARLAVAKRDAAEATGILAGVVRRRPGNSEGWRLLGVVHEMQGKPDEAFSDFQKAARTKPDSEPAFWWLFRMSDAAHRYTQALGCLRQLALLRPDDPRIRGGLCDYLGQHGKVSEALEIRRQWAAEYPDDAGNRRAIIRLCIAQNFLDEAQRWLEPLLEKQPGVRENVEAAAQLDLAWNRPDAGRRKLEEFVRKRGAGAVVEDWVCLGRYLRQMKAVPDRILDAYNRALPLQDPKAMPVTLELAEWQAERGAVGEAVAAYREYREKTGDCAVCPAVIRLLMRDNQAEEAGRELDAWRRATAPAWSSLQAMVSAQVLKADGKLEQAAGELGRAIKRDAGNAQLYFVRAQLLFGGAGGNRGRDQVKADLEQAIALEPGLVHARELLQEWYLSQSYADKAGEQGLQLQKLRQSLPAYRLQLAQLYARQGRDGELEPLLKEAIRDGDAPVWHQMLARLYLKRGWAVEAVAELAGIYSAQAVPTPDITAQYADILLAAGQPKRAVDVLDKNAAQLKAFPVLNVIRGRALAAAGRKTDAEAAFAEAVRLTAGSYEDLGAVADQLQLVEQAEGVIRRLDAMRDGRQPGAVDAVAARLRIQTGKMAEAMAILEPLAAASRDDQPLHLAVLALQGDADNASGWTAKAQAAYDEILRIQPNHLTALNNLAVIYTETLKMPEKAIPMAQRAVAAATADPAVQAAVLDTLGRAQCLAERVADSILTFRRSLELSDREETRLHLAEALIQLNRPAEARNELLLAQEMAEKQKNAILAGRAETLLGTLGPSLDALQPVLKTFSVNPRLPAPTKRSGKRQPQTRPEPPKPEPLPKWSDM